MKKIIAAASVALLLATGCTPDPSAADRANENLSIAADNFEVPRRIVGINAITGDVLFSVEGFCSIQPGDRRLDVTCLLDRASGEIQRTTLGLADNVTFVSTQMEGVEVDLFRPRIILRPETLVPNFDLSTS